MAQENFTRRISIYIDSGQAQAAYDKLVKSQENLNKSLDNLKAKYKQAYDDYVKNPTKESEAAVKKFGQAIDDTKAKIIKNTEALEKQAKKISGELSPSLKDLRDNLAKANQELNRMSKEDPGFAKKQAEVKLLDDAVKSYGKSVLDSGKSWKDMLSMVGGISVGTLIGNWATSISQSIGSAFSSLWRLRTEFESSSRTLSAITGVDGAALEYLQAAAVRMSATSTKSAGDFLEAMKLIASAKPELLQNKEALAQVTEEALRLSKASGLDLPEAATRLTDALNQYSAGADQAAMYVDILAAAAKYGSAEVPGLTQALLEFGPVAKQNNITMEESAAAIELLAEKGVKGAEAGTKLRNVFLTMSAVDALPAAALDQLKKFGVNTDLLTDKNKSLVERLTELSKVANDATAMMQVFDKQNVVAGTIMLQNIPRLQELTALVEEQGVASAQAASNTATWTNVWGKFTNSISALFLGFPLEGLKGFVSGLTDAFNWLGKVTGAIKSQSEAMEKDRVSMNALVLQITSLNEGSAERRKLIEQLNNQYPTFLGNLDKERATNEQLRDRLKDVNKEYVNKIILQRQGEAIEEQANKTADIQMQRMAAEEKLSASIVKYREKYNIALAETKKVWVANPDKNDLENPQIQVEMPTTLTEKANQLAAALDKIKSPNATFFGSIQTAIRDLDVYITQVRLLSGTEAQANKELEALSKKRDYLAKLLGDAGKESEPATQGAPSPAGPGLVTATDEEKKKAEELAKFIDQLRRELFLGMLDDNAREIQALNNKYKDLREKAAGNKEALSLLDKRYYQELSELTGKQAREWQEYIKKNGSGVAEAITKLNTSNSLAIIDIQEANRRSTEEIKKYWASLSETIQGKMQGAMVVIQSALSVLSSANQLMAASENAELARDKKVNDAKKANLQKQLDAKRINQQTYNHSVLMMDKELDKKQAEIRRKQFERDKAAKLIEGALNVAAAVIANLKYGPIVAGIVGGLGLVQLGIIAAQPVPEYESGTESWRTGLPGEPHSGPNGGNPVIDPATGATIAKVEAGEAIIPADTTRANKGLIRRLLANRGRSLDAARVAENVYAQGGYFKKTYGTTSTMPAQVFEELLDKGRAKDRAFTSAMPAQVFEELKGMVQELKRIKGQKVNFVQYDYERFQETQSMIFKRQL